jgi:signal transduction histidine kinase
VRPRVASPVAILGGLMALSILCLVGAALTAASVSRRAASSGMALQEEAAELGRRLSPHFEQGPPSRQTSLGQLMAGDRRVEHTSAALLLAGRVLWADPPTAAPPDVVEPDPGGETLGLQGASAVFAKRYGDGRLFVLSLTSPSLTREKSIQGTALGILVAASLVFLLASTWTGLRWLRSRQGLESTLREAESLLASPQREGSTPAVVELFQKTLAELRKRTEALEALHREEKRRAEDVESLAEALCANLEAGYLRFDEGWRLTGLNAAGRSLLGLPVVPRLGDGAEGLLSERPEVLETLSEVRQSRALVVRDEVPGAAGRSLQVTGLPLYNLLHQLRGFLIVLRDQTAVYAMRKTLREREALSRLGEVAAGVAHEVRNALSAFSANLRLLSEDDPGIADNLRFQALREESRRLDQVVTNLLVFAKPLPLLKEPLSASGLLSAEAEALRAAHPQIEVSVECPEDLTVDADMEAIERALRNLSRNAAEAVLSEGARSPVVRLSGRAEGDGAALIVEDAGEGVSPEALAQLFVPFSSQKPGGTGLGLAIARKIAREHGGDVECEPSPLGGAAFILKLPADRPAGS